MKRIVLVLSLLIVGLGAKAQFQGITLTSQRNNATGEFRWISGSLQFRPDSMYAKFGYVQRVKDTLIHYIDSLTAGGEGFTPVYNGQQQTMTGQTYLYLPNGGSASFGAGDAATANNISLDVLVGPTTNLAQFAADDDNILMGVNSNVGNSRGTAYLITPDSVGLILKASGVNQQLLVYDQLNHKGLEGQEDFSANYDANSYVQKSYVDAHSGGGGGSYWALSSPTSQTVTQNGDTFAIGGSSFHWGGADGTFMGISNGMYTFENTSGDDLQIGGYPAGNGQFYYESPGDNGITLQMNYAASSGNGTFSYADSLQTLTLNNGNLNWVGNDHFTIGDDELHWAGSAGATYDMNGSGFSYSSDDGSSKLQLINDMLQGANGTYGKLITPPASSSSAGSVGQLAVDGSYFYYYNGSAWMKFAGSASGTTQINSDWNASSGVAQILNKPALATVATSGAYGDLSGKPTNVSSFTNDAHYLTSYTETDPTVPAYSKSLINFATIKASTDALYVSLNNGYVNPITGIPLLPVNATIGGFGDSEIGMANYQTTTAAQNLNSGMLTFIQQESNSVLYLPINGNQGVSGNTTAQMLARLGSALALKPSLVIIEAGTNDLTASTDVATIEKNLMIIWRAYLASGARVIAVTILPRFAPSALSTGNETNRQTINAWMLSLNITGLTVFNADALGLTSADFQTDGLHLSSIGAYLVGTPIGDIVAGMVESKKITSTLGQDQLYTANEYLAGTSGSGNTGATGTFANNITVTGNSSGLSGISAVGKIDTVGSEFAQRITLSGSYTTSNNGYVSMAVDANSVPQPGDLIEGMAEYEIVQNDPNVIGLDFYGGPATSGFAGIATVDSYNPTLAESNQFVTGHRYITRTPPIYVPYGTLPAYLFDAFKVILKNGTSQSINFTYRVYKIAFRKINSPNGNSNLSIPVAAAIQSSVSTPVYSYATKTAAYTLLTTDFGIKADATGGAFSITLPTSGVTTGKAYLIKRINSGSNAITIVGTIDGNTNYSLSAQYKYVQLTYNGTSWDITANN